MSQIKRFDQQGYLPAVAAVAIGVGLLALGRLLWPSQ
jgi:hypothetical protein